jgi:geranylgeranyl pyrophosphate synthase
VAAALPADQRSLQQVLAGNPGAAENRRGTQKERNVLKTPQTDDLARGNHVVPTEWAEQLERERDGAREKYDNEATEHMLAINKICNERDEAREIAQQLIHIASHCLGWHENANPETITEAIKRWNASTKK